MMRFLRSGKGFTLVELMIVVAIIGILAGVAIPRYMNFVRRSREAACKGNLGTLRSALNIYYSDTEGIFPAKGPTGVDNAACGLRINPFLGTGADNYIDAIPPATEDCQDAQHKINGALLPIPQIETGIMGAAGAQNGGWMYLTLNTNFSSSVARIVVDCLRTDSRKPLGTIISTW